MAFLFFKMVRAGLQVKLVLLAVPMSNFVWLIYVQCILLNFLTV